MRQIGTLSEEEKARTLGDYLLTRGVETSVEPADGEWAVWVYDEDRVEDAKKELAEFLENPGDPRYVKAAKSAAEVRQATARKQKQARKNFVDVRQRWQRPVTSRCPVTITMMIISVFVGMATQLGGSNQPLSSKLSITSYEPTGDGRIRFSWGLPDVKRGEVWRLVTPIFLHFNILHILFNMYMFMHFGMMVETLRGSWRFLLMVLVIAVLSNLGEYSFGGQDFSGTPMFGGMSGVVYGLFGYIWMKSKFDPGSGFYLQQSTVVILVGWFILCWSPLLGSIANIAHTVGLAVGMLIGRGSALAAS